MSEEMMNTKEVAEYLGIHEKQVYALIKARRIPSTKNHGKVGLSKETDRRMDRIQCQCGARKSQGEEQAHERGAAGMRQQ